MTEFTTIVLAKRKYRQTQMAHLSALVNSEKVKNRCNTCLCKCSN